MTTIDRQTEAKRRKGSDATKGVPAPSDSASRSAATPALVREPGWYKDAVIYQLHVRSFCDSDADGTGDFDGLTSKLDYLSDLGVDTIWLLPFFPSPLRDDGYDIADYESVNPAYGDLAAFRRFLREAHARGLRVIIELVMNHTSDQHPWFQRARVSPPGSRFRNFYVWSDDATKYQEARIIFQDFETSNWTWDPVAQSHYWHRFYSHQPDLNFESADVRKAMFGLLDRWFKMGVDGVRLDAIPYLFEAEGTNCENLPETHAFLRDVRTHMDERFPDRLLLAEANQWPEDAVEYFGDGDECHMAFHFPVMPRLFMGLQMESRTPIVDILEQTPDIPEGCQWAMFLRNHDELTLEMVTDEERDYMYRRFAGDPRMRVNVGIRRRLGPLLQDDRRKVELLNALLFSLPGTPIIYYGDEIGMGDNVYLGDRDAVRTPMQWSDDRNAGFSRANPQQLFLPLIIDPQHHYEAVNVDAQRRNPSSLWWWMRRLIALRQAQPVFGRGKMELLDSDNPKVLTFLRTMEDGDDVLVVANLSRHAQQVYMPLPGYVGVEPVELFGQTKFDEITDRPYRLTIGPHGFYWLRLRTIAPTDDDGPAQLPFAQIKLPLNRADAGAIAAAAPGYMTRQRWFGDRNRTRSDISIVENVSVGQRSFASFVQVDFTEGESQLYFVPLTESPVDKVAPSRPDMPPSIVGITKGGRTVLHDAFADPSYATTLARFIARGEEADGEVGELVGRPVKDRKVWVPSAHAPAKVLGVEQSNSSYLVDDKAILKVLRRVEHGRHPEAELLQHLSKKRFPHVPALLGTLTYRTHWQPDEMTVATLVEFVPSDGDAWLTMSDEVARFFEWTAAQPDASRDDPNAVQHALDSGNLREPLAQSLSFAGLIARRLAQLHIALADSTEPRMKPEPFTRLHQRSLYQGLRSEVRRILGGARRVLGDDAAELAVIERAVLDRYAELTKGLITGDRIRVHGDLHLGQILGRAGDVTFIDFEGEPARPLGERSIKRTPLVDVAGMIRSFDYAAHHGAADAVLRGIATADRISPWAVLWSSLVSEEFLGAYLAELDGNRLVPSDPAEFELLLDVSLLQKMVYEVGYELNSRPEWAFIPLGALRRWQARDSSPNRRLDTPEVSAT